MTTQLATLSGWGRVPVVQGREVQSEDLESITIDAPLTRGLGRAYGDAALPAPTDYVVAGTVLADQIRSFDPETGVLTAEAGLSLDTLYRVFLPRGFFAPVTPGTRFVTLGGMVAADVHGKNHHVEGCFGRHVTALKIRVASGALLTCSPTENEALFRATLGGMGLTGHILEVAVRLTRVASPWIRQETERIDSLDRFLDALKQAAARWPNTVGWIDCLSKGASMGRGILYKGRWADPGEAPTKFPALKHPITLPCNLPDGVLGTFSVRAFNLLNYRRHLAATSSRIVHPESFFYPLDMLGEWYRLYGRRGFTQYQCVIPEAGGRDAVRRFLELVVESGCASFLSVIKDCGPEGTGILSFPMTGTSIALDIPMRPWTQGVVNRLNERIIKEGGRIYLAKDALTLPEHFRAMEPRLDTFLQIRRQWDPGGRIRSAQSLRLFGW